MTRGKDVSSLFTDIVKNMVTTDMELKKLIYLYIINYAKVINVIIKQNLDSSRFSNFSHKYIQKRF
jgi:vesicle coat complex subunit